MINVFSNYIPNKWITIDDKDPPWMNDEIRNKMNYRNNFYQQLKKYRLNLTNFDVMNELTSELSSIISQRKNEYYSRLAKKLNDPQTNAKTYWSILKTFFNGRKMNFLVVNVHLLTMVANVQVSLILLLMRDFPQLCLMIKISLRLLEL